MKISPYLIIRIIFPLFIVLILISSYGSDPFIPPEPELQDPVTPPPEKFVDLAESIPSIRIEIRYATTNNFTGKILKGYGAQRAYMLRVVAKKLAKVQEELQSQGLSLKVWDSYRPLRAELEMLEWAREHKRFDLLEGGYLNSRINPHFIYGHPNGNAIDCTIVDAEGKELDMGTDFDEFSKKAWTMHAGGTVLENRLLLKNLMEKNGFRSFSREWWHFTDWHTPEPLHDEVIMK